MNPYYGYYFHPKSYPHAPGSPRLDICIPAIPGQAHYDPQCVELFVRVEGRPPGIERLVVEPPWAQPGVYPVCAGQISLCERDDRKVCAFTFGGELRIAERPGWLECCLQSPAPILDLSGGNPIAVILAEETEILFAERRAIHLEDADFEARLAVADPGVLYAACLAALQDRYAEMPHHGLPEATAFRSFLRAELAALEDQGRWPGRAARLEEIL